MRKNLSPYILAVAALVFGFFTKVSAQQCATWSTTYPTQCTNGPAITLSGGLPIPGVYFGPGVIGTGPYQFSPVTAGVGTHKIGYTASGCVPPFKDTAYVFITVSAPPTVTLGALGPYCENRDSVTLSGGSPTTGGTGYYYGSGVNSSSGKFGPTIGAAGSPYAINYSFTSAASGCTNLAQRVVTINPVTLASISGLDTAYCSNHSPQTIAVSTGPVGGTLTGPGVSGSNFNINNAGVGFHDIKYYYTNTSNCTDTAHALVHVRALPTVTLGIPGPQKFVCEFDGPYGITGQTPTSPGWPSSWFTGKKSQPPFNGVDTVLSTFDPDPSLVGWNVIIFHYFDGVCTNTKKDSILVNENPDVVLNPFPEPCVNDDPFPMNQGTPSSSTATYSGSGVTGGGGVYYFNPSLAGAGTHTITYCFTATNGCETCVSQNIKVNPIPSVTFNSPSFPVLCENTGEVDLNTSTYVSPTNGVFSGPGIGTNGTSWYPMQLGPGSYNITYTYVDTATGCENATTQSLTIYPTPKVKFTTNPTAILAPDSMRIKIKLCVGDTAILDYTSSPPIFALTVLWPNNYIQNGNTHTFFPDTNFVYPMIASGNNGCVDTGIVDIEVIQPAEAVITGLTNICIGDSTTLVASGATTYEWVSPVANTASVTVVPTIDTYYEVVAVSDKDGNGDVCSRDTTAVEVRVNPLPLITAMLDTTIFLGDQVKLKAFAGVSYI
ncbi:MAG TPA: hypothetical protein DCX54_11370, partial [Flavobacteriales bacterium]|nr:hypothetical protein [Flavobacteriales bacterium]